MAQTTKKMLAQALTELLKTKPLNKITISDITGRCGINRMTFYYHFKDIYELIDWLVIETGVIPLEKDIYRKGLREGLMYLMEKALAHKSVLINIYDCMSREQIEKYLMRVFRTMFDDIINKMSEGMDISDEDKAFVVYFYNKALCGSMLDWISGGMKKQPDELVDKLNRMLKGNLEFSIKNMCKN